MSDAQPATGHCGVRVFINYRREDTKHAAGRLRDALVARFGKHCVFVDVEDIEPGTNWVDAIDQAVSRCDFMLVLIGAAWLDAGGADRPRRLEEPSDRLRMEIEAGLRHATRVIPVLVDSAKMPKRADLPPSLSELTEHQFTRVRHETFHDDTSRLLRVLDRAAGREGPPSDDELDGPPRPKPVQPPANALASAALGLLAAAVLALVLTSSLVEEATLASRPNLPRSGPWATVTWLLPAPFVLVAVGMLSTGRRIGAALGCVLGVALWVVTSWLLALGTLGENLGAGAFWSHVVVLALLVAGGATAVATSPSLRARGRTNRWDRMFVCLVLLAAAVVLRAAARALAQAVTHGEPVQWSGVTGIPSFWASALIPLALGLPAAFVLWNEVQAQALVAATWLQVVYVFLLLPLRWGGMLDNPDVTLTFAIDVTFLLGCLCLLMAVRVGQPRARRADR